MFGCLLEITVQGPKVNTSRVNANMETVAESGENVISTGIGIVTQLVSERLEIKRGHGGTYPNKEKPRVSWTG